MHWIRKNVLLILLAVTSIAAIELYRERVVYERINADLEQGIGKLRDGLTKEQVKKILGEPQSIGRNDDKEVWSWDTSQKNGALSRFLGFKARGVFVTVYFNSQGKMVDMIHPS